METTNNTNPGTKMGTPTCQYHTGADFKRCERDGSLDENGYGPWLCAEHKTTRYPNNWPYKVTHVCDLEA